MASALQSITLRRLAIATVVVMGAGYALAFLYAPEDADQGFIQKIFYLHVPLATVALLGFIVAAIHAIRHLRTGDPKHDARSYVSIHISVIFGAGVLLTGAIWAKGSVGRLVGVAGADAGQLPDRLPALRHLLPAPLRDRGPRAPGPLRVGLRDHRRGLRAAQLPGRPTRPAARPSTHLLVRRRPARLDAVRLPRLPRRHGPPLDDTGLVRARCEGGVRATSERIRRRPGGDGVIPLAIENADRYVGGGLPRLPPAAADLRGDHGREAPADPARAGSLADLADRPQGRSTDRGVGQVREREEEIEAVRQGGRG